MSPEHSSGSGVVNSMALSVTLHNIPEGMAVGVVLAGWMAGESTIPLAGAMIYVVVEELIPEASAALR